MKSLRLSLLCLFIFLAVDLSATDYALFFAVEDYDNMGELNNPIDDATAIAAELKTNYGFQTEVVTNPTFTQIADKIAAYQQKFASGAYDQKGQLLVFFSGHGVQRGNNGYFIPKDGNPSKLYETCIEYDIWRYEIDQIDCQHILVTIDACYSLTFDPNWTNKTDRTFGRRGDAAKDQVLLDHKAYRARHFFTSDGTNKQTPDRSTLARQFLTGLKSNKSTTGYLTTSELYASYLLRAAPKPGGGDFGRDEVGSRFLFFRKQTIIPTDLRADLAAWQAAQAQNNCAAYRTYLETFSNGDFAALASQQVTACDEEEKMLEAWVAAKQANDCAGYEVFERNYPSSPYFAAATAKRKELNCDAGTVPDNMVFISGGTFQMGDQFGDGRSDEKPIHAVTLSDFYLSRTELTNREYAEFLSAMGNQVQGGTEWYEIESEYAGISVNGRSFLPKSGQGDHPVLKVSWYGAVAYCNWLSEQHGLTAVYRISGTKVTPNWSANGYRLPTEAEWEYAARSGGKKEKWAGTFTENELTQFANYSGKGDGYDGTAPVGMLRANNLGLADMSGNVWEWCWDWYGSDYYGKPIGNNPKGPDTGACRVFRGGSWFSYPANCRAAFRYGREPTSRNNGVGFRLARSSRQGE
jgi:formylglycine-generating enzyme required for sulfatase activity